MVAALFTSPLMLALLFAGILACSGLIHILAPHTGTLVTHHYLLDWITPTNTATLPHGQPTTLLHTLTYTPIWQWPLPFFQYPMVAKNALWLCFIGHGLWQWLNIIGHCLPNHRGQHTLALGLPVILATIAICPGFVLPLSLPVLPIAGLFWCCSTAINTGLSLSNNAGTKMPSAIITLWLTLLLLSMLWLGGITLGTACIGFTLLGWVAIHAQIKQATPQRRNQRAIPGSTSSLSPWQVIFLALGMGVLLALLVPLACYMADAPDFYTPAGINSLPKGLVAIINLHLNQWIGMGQQLIHNSLAASTNVSIVLILKTILWQAWATAPLWLLALFLLVSPSPQQRQASKSLRATVFSIGAWALWWGVSLALLPWLSWAALLPPTIICARLAKRLHATTPDNPWVITGVDIAMYALLLGSIAWLFIVFYIISNVFPGSQWHGPGTPIWDPLPQLFPIPLPIWQWWLVPLSLGMLIIAGLLYWLQSKTTLLPKLAGLWACGLFLWAGWFFTITPTFNRNYPIPPAMAKLLPPAPVTTTAPSALTQQILPDITAALSHKKNVSPMASITAPASLALLAEADYFALPATTRNTTRAIHQWRPWPLTALPLGTQWGLFPVPFWRDAFNPQQGKPSPRVLLTLTTHTP